MGGERAVFLSDLGQVASAFRSLYLVGHGISERLTQSVVGYVRWFFRAAGARQARHQGGFTATCVLGSNIRAGEQDWREQVDIGDARSLAIHPASTTHQQLDSEEQLAAGVRLAIGIGYAENIIGDFAQILDAVGGTTMQPPSKRRRDPTERH